MKKHIVCYGDSNTHGFCADPADSADGGIRFNEDERYPCVLQKMLGDDYIVLEEGMNGRTSSFDDPLIEGANGLSAIVQTLKCHEPVDLLIIMLGTNDTKSCFGQCSKGIAYGLRRILKKAIDTECWDGKKPSVLYVCPPVIPEEIRSRESAEMMGPDCWKRSKELSKYMETFCKELDVDFLDADGIEVNRFDYLHLTKKGHQQLAGRLYRYITGLNL